jgi:hypothetical protein
MQCDAKHDMSIAVQLDDSFVSVLLLPNPIGKHRDRDRDCDRDRDLDRLIRFIALACQASAY